MPKLKLNQDFVKKLNSINLERTNSSTNLKSEEKKASKFKITEDNTPFIPTIPKISKKNPIFNKKDIDMKFPKLVLEHISEIGLMWESFDDSIKKIVLSEIIEKYYLYKTWKFNSLSFISGFLFALLIVFVVKVIT